MPDRRRDAAARRAVRTALDGPDDTSRTVWRVRLVAVCLALSALAFLQDAGLIVVDTKFDLPWTRPAR